MRVIGMYGIGDNLHQRAVLRELMKSQHVELEGFYPAMVHDLVAAGLKFIPLQSGRHPPRIRAGEESLPASRAPAAEHMRLTYSPDAIKRRGSILAAQFASCGLDMPAQPDFSLPVPQAWRDKAQALIAGWDMRKPLLIYRPIVRNKIWECPSRSPDPAVYAAIFRSLRDGFFVVSVADLTQQEWIVGEEEEADVKLHSGEVDFETLAGLFARSALVFCNPGFSPVLAQAVGAPSVIVYGGNESFRTTNAVGAHLAPTLAIEPINPCECHARVHDCDKRIDLPAATARLEAFVGQLACAY
jgi:hypothetical protein